MKIPNYDKKHKESKKKLNDFLDEDFRMLITGQTRSIKYSFTLQATPNQHQEKMVDFQQIIIKGKLMVTM